MEHWAKFRAKLSSNLRKDLQPHYFAEIKNHQARLD
jgi:hypothetical protein